MPTFPIINHKGYSELCVEALRNSGARVTEARLAVIAVLEQADMPLSAPAIVELLGKRKSSPSLDKASVYRVLERFLALGLVHRVPPSGDYLACSHLECQGVQHVIARCTDCGSVNELDIPAEAIAPLLLHLRHKAGFQPNPHVLHMDGLCHKCAKQS